MTPIPIKYTSLDDEKTIRKLERSYKNKNIPIKATASRYDFICAVKSFKRRKP